MGSLILWWLGLEVLGLISLPVTFHLFSARAAHGYAFGKIIALLLITYVSWLLSHAGVPVHISLPLTLAGFIAGNAVLAWRNRDQLGQWWKGPGQRAIVLHDLLWTAGFLFFAWQRSLGPEIFGAEKYMDFAFFNTLIRTDVLPPQDPWMAGQPFNYYYFGYLMFANLARFTPVSPHIAYNLCVITVGGLAFAEMAAIGLTLTRRLPFALLTGAMAMVIGNLDGLLQLWEKRGFTQFDYWRSSRIVAHGDTINEFPYFTTIHGDLHPHFIVLPVSILLLALLLDPERTKRIPVPGQALRFAEVWGFVPITFVLASMVVISPWELPVGAMMTFLLLGRDLPLFPLLSWPRLQHGLRVAVMLVASYVLYLPFYRQFAAPPGGVGAKFAQTSLYEFLIVFGALLLPAALFLADDFRSRLRLGGEQRQLLAAAAVLVTLVGYLEGNAVFIVLLGLGVAAFVCAYGTEDLERRAALLLVLGASVALLACEFVYIKDPYGDKLYRMNTVFKLYFQSWILLAIAAPWCWAQLIDGRRVAASLRSLTGVSVSALLLASCAYPVGITATRLHGRVPAVTLDGTEYLSREHPDDFAAIRWIRETIPDLPVVLEASGDPYSYYARFSSNTGLPTIMGWSNHEGLWRNNDHAVGERRADVARLYNAPTLAEVEPLLDRYQIKYIVVGELERKDYHGAGLEKFAQLPVAFAHGGTTVYRR